MSPNTLEPKPEFYISSFKNDMVKNCKDDDF